MKLIVVFALLLSQAVFSQETMSRSYEESSLTEILKDVEKRFNVKFSFNSEIIEGKQITATFNEISLEDVLFKIEIEFHIQFNKISERYYTIVKQELNTSSKTQSLSPVIVKSYLIKGIDKNKDGSISILPDKLGILPGLTEPDVFESLQLIPGVQSPNETASGLYIRGGTPDQNLVLWDGIKIYYSGHFFGMLSAFNPYIIDEVKLFKSGTEARYGNRISGVIDMSSKNEITNKTKGGFGFNMTHADVFLQTPISEKVGFLFSARRSFTDIYQSPTFNKLSDRVFQNIKIAEENGVKDNNLSSKVESDFFFTDYTAKIIVEPSEDDKLSLSTLFTKNTLNYNFDVPEIEYNLIDNLEIKNLGLSFVWNKKWDSKLSHQITSYYSNYNFDYIGDGFFIENYTDKSTKRNIIDDVGFSAHLKYSFKESKNLLFGYQFASNKISYQLGYTNIQNQTSIISDDGNNNMHSIFSEYEYHSNKMQINAGIRLNYFSVTDDYFIEPRIYSEYKINNSYRLKGSMERKNQSISQIVEFQTSSLGFGLENQVWALANQDDIPIQKSNQATIGVLFNKSNWKIDIEAYHKWIKGMTSFTRGYNDQRQDFSNGKGTILGVDVLVNKNIKNYRTWVGYSYTKNQFKFTDLENEFFPANHDITHMFSWSHTYKINNFEGSLGWIYRTGVPYTKAIGIEETPENLFILIDSINEERLPNYSRLNASIIYNFKFSKNKKWKGKLGLSLANILNQKNVLNRTYQLRPFINSANEIEYQLREVDKLSLGITPNLVFRVEF
jgi:hypothetical protein